jgi:hypothetical protein
LYLRIASSKNVLPSRSGLNSLNLWLQVVALEPDGLGLVSLLDLTALLSFSTLEGFDRDEEAKVHFGLANSTLVVVLSFGFGASSRLAAAFLRR